MISLYHHTFTHHYTIALEALVPPQDISSSPTTSPSTWWLISLLKSVACPPGPLPPRPPPLYPPLRQHHNSLGDAGARQAPLHRVATVEVGSGAARRPLAHRRHQTSARCSLERSFTYLTRYPPTPSFGSRRTWAILHAI
jgi:hypothetical protein